MITYPVSGFAVRLVIDNLTFVPCLCRKNRAKVFEYASRVVRCSTGNMSAMHVNIPREHLVELQSAGCPIQIRMPTVGGDAAHDQH